MVPKLELRGQIGSSVGWYDWVKIMTFSSCVALTGFVDRCRLFEIQMQHRCLDFFSLNNTFDDLVEPEVK